MPKSTLEVPNPELIDEENPEWTDEMFASGVPLSRLSKELQELLAQPKTIRPDADGQSAHDPAA